MSSRQLEEMQERRQAEMLANALGCTVEDLDAQHWDLDENESASGYIVTFHDAEPEFLREVGAEDGWTTVSINAFDEPDYDDEG